MKIIFNDGAEGTILPMYESEHDIETQIPTSFLFYHPGRGEIVAAYNMATLHSELAPFGGKVLIH